MVKLRRLMLTASRLFQVTSVDNLFHQLDKIVRCVYALKTLSVSLLCCCVFFISGTTALRAEPKNISIAVQIYGGVQRAHVSKALEAFHAEQSRVRVHFDFYRDNSYVDLVEQWLKSGENAPDIIFWYGGRRVAHYANQDLLQDLSEFWLQSNAKRLYPKVVRDAAIVNGRPFALPVAVSLVGLYADDFELRRMGVGVPSTWSEMIAACRTLAQSDKSLFAVGSMTDWTMHAWFDYLNLRVHGIEFYQKVLNGDIAYTDPRVLAVFERWKALLDADCFNANHAQLDADGAFPRILHGLSAFVLTNYVPTLTEPRRFEQRLRIFPFPEIVPGISAHTVSPKNVFIVPKHVELGPSVIDALHFLQSAEFQKAFSKNTFQLPARIQEYEPRAEVIRGQAKMIIESPSGIQYFDRDTKIEFASHSPKIFVDFLSHRNPKRISQQLETLRQKVFKTPEN